MGRQMEMEGTELRDSRSGKPGALRVRLLTTGGGDFWGHVVLSQRARDRAVCVFLGLSLDCQNGQLAN